MKDSGSFGWGSIPHGRTHRQPSVAYVLERFPAKVAYVLERFSAKVAYVLEKSSI